MIFYVGIDNGVSGSVAAILADCSRSFVMETPTFSEQDYVQKKANVTRINVKKLTAWFRMLNEPGYNVRLTMERPMVNPMRFKATASALRAWEATLIALQPFPWPRMVIDSRKWQKAMLPEGAKGPELKSLSVQVGCRLFPCHKEWIVKQGDADSLLIAEAARRNKW